ncbi:MAG: hypothetical protein JWN52_7533 [Actinomycetia bacterium]|nr:hypothetical protein [Actinomycetes bacterium]
MHKVTKAALMGLIVTPVLTTALATPGNASTIAVGHVSAKAAAGDCPKGFTCFWTKKNFQGTRRLVHLGHKCVPNLHHNGKRITITVWSLTTQSVGATMYTKVNCKGTPSMSYVKGKKIKNAYGFKMASVT